MVVFKGKYIRPGKTSPQLGNGSALLTGPGFGSLHDDLISLQPANTDTD